MADMLAYEARNRMRQIKANPGSKPSELLVRLTHGGIHQPRYQTSESLKTIAARVIAMGAEYEDVDGVEEI